MNQEAREEPNRHVSEKLRGEKRFKKLGGRTNAGKGSEGQSTDWFGKFRPAERAEDKLC